MLERKIPSMARIDDGSTDGSGELCDELLEMIYYQELFDTNAWSKVMKIHIAKKHPFVEGILYEDFDNVHKLICDCESILYISEPKYFYRQRSNSIMNGSFSERNLLMIDIAQEHIDFVEEKFPDMREAAIRRYVHSNFYILGKTFHNICFMQKSDELGVRRKEIMY